MGDLEGLKFLKPTQQSLLKFSTADLIAVLHFVIVTFHHYLVVDCDCETSDPIKLDVEVVSRIVRAIISMSLITSSLVSAW